MNVVVGCRVGRAKFEDVSEEGGGETRRRRSCEACVWFR